MSAGRCRSCGQLSGALYSGICEACATYLVSADELPTDSPAVPPTAEGANQPVPPAPRTEPGPRVESSARPGGDGAERRPAPSPEFLAVAQAEADLLAVRLLRCRARLAHVTDADIVADRIAEREARGMTDDGERDLRRVRGILLVLKTDLERELSAILGGV